MTDAKAKLTPEDARDLLTFARMEARKAVKEQWRAEGLKLLDWTRLRLS